MRDWTHNFTCLSVTETAYVRGTPCVCCLQWTFNSFQERLKQKSKSMYLKDILYIYKTLIKANLERTASEQGSVFVISSNTLPSRGNVRNCRLLQGSLTNQQKKPIFQLATITVLLLEQSRPTEHSVMKESYYICSVQSGSHQLHVATQHL